jgi:hypothetical protein
MRRQRQSASSSIEAARASIKAAYKLDGDGGLPPPRIEPPQVPIYRLPKGNAIPDPWQRWKKLQEE